jgi:hypothetical protein
MGLIWPRAYSKDPVFSFLKPMTMEETGWMDSSSSLIVYLRGQIRWRRSRSRVLTGLLKLRKLVTGYPILESWLERPLETKLLGIEMLKSELMMFLAERFAEHPDAPWAGLVKETVVVQTTFNDLVKSVITPVVREKRQTVNQGWLEQLKALSGQLDKVPEPIRQIDETAFQDVFAPPLDELSLELLSSENHLQVEAPILIGRHFLSQRLQKVWFNNKGAKFQKVINHYARWDDARIILFRDQNVGLMSAMEQYVARSGYKLHGPWLPANTEQPAFFCLLINRQFPVQEFPIFEWRINVKHLTVSVEPLSQRQAA